MSIMSTTLTLTGTRRRSGALGVLLVAGPVFLRGTAPLPAQQLHGPQEPEQSHPAHRLVAHRR